MSTPDTTSARLAGRTATTAAEPNDAARWAAKQVHYQQSSVVESYDQTRFQTLGKFGTTARKWKMIRRAFGEHFASVDTVLDLPCGTGRFTRQFLAAGKRLINADLSLPMLHKARELGQARAGMLGNVCCDAQHLPFADASVDAVVCIRFLFHVPRELRPAMFREFSRISRRWVVLDVRHRYCCGTHWKRLRCKLAGKRPPRERYNLQQLYEDVDAGGLIIRRKIWNYVPFSEKLVLLCEKQR